MEAAQGVKLLKLVQLKGMCFLIGPPIGDFFFHSLHYVLAAAVPPGTSLEKLELS